MIDYAVPRTTYYSLAKDRLKEKHPMVYNLVLIFVLLTLIGTAAFLISDILSFALDYDNENIQINSGLPGPEKSSVFTSLWNGNKENRSPMEDIEPKLGLTDGLLTANSSPKMSRSNSMAPNSTAKDDMAKTTEELNSSDPSQNRSSISQAMSSTTSAMKVSTSTSASKSHRSSSSSSKSSSEEKESEQTPTGSNNESTNNTAANNTASSETSITQFPGSLSIRFPNANETGIVQHQINSTSVGSYRNESPQKIKGAPPESRLDERKSERTEESTSEEKQGNLNSLDSYRPQEESAQTKSASYSYFESDRSIQEMASAIPIDFNGAKDSETVPKSVPNEILAQSRNLRHYGNAFKDTDICKSSNTRKDPDPCPGGYACQD